MSTIRTLLPMACDGRGPSQTCVNLLPGLMAAGFDVDLFADRARVPLDHIPHTLTVPPIASKLPHRHLSNLLARRTERRLLSSVQPGELVYSWPAASIDVHRELHRRGNPVILEGINTRMKAAKVVLDEAYRAEGLPPGHGITQQRIDEEEEKLELADYIFAPSLVVEESLATTDLATRGRMLSGDYGVSAVTDAPISQTVVEPTFLFVGLSGVRKGLHLLLRAWDQANVRGRLLICGRIDEDVASLCARELRRDDVEYLGFTNDVASAYRRANVFVFPSLEEGSPLVTIEAAAHGLPIIASRAGAGRLSEKSPLTRVVDPYSLALVHAIRDFADSRELREAAGREAHAVAAEFTWPVVGERRGNALRSHLGLDT